MKQFGNPPFLGEPPPPPPLQLNPLFLDNFFMTPLFVQIPKKNFRRRGRKLCHYSINGELLCKILSEAASPAVDLNHSHYENFRTFLRMIYMAESNFFVMLLVKRLQRY